MGSEISTEDRQFEGDTARVQKRKSKANIKEVGSGDEDPLSVGDDV